MGADYELIETPAGLESIVKALRGEPVIAVDLEADSMYHFQEKVCLLQLAFGKMNAVIDPLKVQDLSPLKPVFAAAGVQKVFHGADYDVRSLYRDFQIEINNLFDTELASRFLGIPGTGLEAVLQARFNVKLNKKFQRKDWSRRPLSGEMMAYAAGDVKYLLPLARMLEDELKDTGRLAWVYEECGLLSNVRAVQNDHEPLFVHFKGAGRLGARSLAVLEGLLQFRKKVARKKDRPLFKVFSNQSLMNLALKKPVSTRQLEKADVLSRKQINMYGDAIIGVIADAKAQPAADLPTYPRKKAVQVHPRVPDRIKALKVWRNRKAKSLGIEAGLLINKNLMTVLAVENPHDRASLERIPELKKWQKTEFGQDLIAILAKSR
jgi:ribonuclease D